MEKYVIFLFFSTLLSAVITTPDVRNPRFSKQYRSDYVYNHETDAFYKLHIETCSQWRSTKVCRTEGADVMTLDSEKDILQLHTMFKEFPDLGEFVWVADDGKEHEAAQLEPFQFQSANEPGLWKNMVLNPIQQGLVWRRNGELRTAPSERQFPFICKVKAADAPYDPHCGLYGTGYKYFESTGSCYKIPHLSYTWSEAYSECEAEGSHLVVINSVLEHKVLHNFTNTEKKVTDAKFAWFFFAGFRADMPKNTNTTAPSRVFKTIFNETLEEAGYSLWTDGEPNNIKGSEYCGTIYIHDGKFNDVNCGHQHPFICEKELLEPDL